jgi:hypothetical protein
MAAALDRSGAPTHNNRGERAVSMPIAVADAAAKQEDRMIEQRAVAVRCGSKFLEVIREQRHVIGLDLGALLHLLRLVLVMSQRMMGFGNANLRIRPSILLSAIHEGSHPCQIGLESQQLEIVEKSDVRFECVGNTYGPRHIGSAVAGFAALLLSLLDATLDVAK